MLKLKEVFQVKVSKNRLQAYLYLNSEDVESLQLSEEQVLQFLREQHITYGLSRASIQKMIKVFPHLDGPVLIAEGIDKTDGKNGELQKLISLDVSIDRTDGWNFRDVMKIPTVQENVALAKIIPPTKGKDGKNVFGKTIQARPGKPYVVKAGKNVQYNEVNQTFYSTIEGQVSFENHIIQVEHVFEVDGDISMEIGNIDFPGNVVIYGDIPAGFTVQADGDIKVFGMVEAATVLAGRSIYISEGFAGLKTGILEAGVNVHIGYINQGRVEAKHDIFVETSIRHARCEAKNNIISKNGNIIGGQMIAGKVIGAKDIGNRMNTATHLVMLTDINETEGRSHIQAEKEKLEQQKAQLEFIQAKTKGESLTSEKRILYLKVTHALAKLTEQLEDINKQEIMQRQNAKKKSQACICATGTIFQNVTVSFGKYERTIDKNYDHATIKLEKNDIIITNI